MTIFTVSWTIEIDTAGGHRDAAKTAAQLCFKANISAGAHDSECSFVVIGEDGIPVNIDLCGSLSDLDGDDTQ